MGNFSAIYTQKELGTDLCTAMELNFQYVRCLDGAVQSPKAPKFGPAAAAPAAAVATKLGCFCAFCCIGFATSAHCVHVEMYHMHLLDYWIKLILD